MEITDCGRPCLRAVGRSDRVVDVQQVHLGGAELGIITCDKPANAARLFVAANCLVVNHPVGLSDAAFEVMARRSTTGRHFEF